MKFQIKEKSMEPAIKEGSTLLVSRYHYFFRKPRVGDVVIIKDPTSSGSAGLRGTRQYIIKRIGKIDKDRVFIVGDNEKESVDSRKFGWISKDNIVGKVI